MTDKGTAVQLAKEPTTLRLTFDGMADRVKEVFDSISRRAYDLFDRNGRVDGRDIENWFTAESELLHPVKVQLAESEEALEIKAEVPGFSEKTLEISVEPTRVVISGNRESTREEKKGKTVYSEIRSNQIMRVIALPAEVNAEKATATLKNGTLELSLPKIAKTQAIKLQPKVAA